VNSRRSKRCEAVVWDDRGLVWPSETGTPLSPSNLRRLLRRQCELARQDAADAIDRSFRVKLPVNDVAPG
jgi:hypothetical protein